MRQEDARIALSESKLIALLPAKARDDFVAKCKVRRYEPRERMMAIGDLIIGPCWMESGLARIHLPWGDGRDYPIGFFWPGSILVTSLADREEWETEVRAVSPVTLVSIPRAVFRDLALREAGLSLAFLSAVSEGLRWRQHWEARLRAVPLRPRLLSILGRAADELGTPTSEGILLDFPFTQGALSFGTITSRDETARAMRDLEGWGYYQRRPRHRILIPDRDRLRTYVIQQSEEA